MKIFIKCVILLCVLNTLVWGKGQYLPDSGDKGLDESLQNIHNTINRKSKKRLSLFIDNMAEKFQVPVEKVEGLFNHYDFKAPDVLMSVSIADVSGEPLQNISGLYYKNKSKGWKYVFQQLNIQKGSPVYEQVKKDAQNIK